MKPKQENDKVDFSKFEGRSLFSPKQPTSIEEAAEQHIKDYAVFFDTKAEINHTKIGFIAGAKSDAAKEYWFKIFEANHNAQFKQEKK